MKERKKHIAGKQKYTYDELRERFKDGKTFTVTFIKKNGETRVMNARLGVKKPLKGGTLSYDPKEKNLLIVYDMQKKAYRCITLESIISIRDHGKEEII